MTMVTTLPTGECFALFAMAAMISTSQFKARCHRLIDQIAATGEVLVITKNGQPVAELHPSVEVPGDLLAPIDSPWAALE
jgi:antitoxin (DNA-binding transcriptional repressor) of toxin-antitoxin stability system